MEIIYAGSFYNLFDQIKDKTIIRRADNTIEKLKSANSLRDVTNIKYMQGYPNYYRIAFGDYRIGFFLVDENTVRLLAIEHRSKFYRFFPGYYS